jgi:hypothetical protein
VVPVDWSYLVVEKIDNDAIRCLTFSSKELELGTIDFFWKYREVRWNDADWAETTVYETIIRKGFQTAWDRILDDESY